MTDVTRRCHACNHPLTLDQKAWDDIEMANGKRYPVRHKGCGGAFVAEVARLGRSA